MLHRLNRLRTGVGRFRSCLYKWGMASSVTCECGGDEQIVARVVLQCPIHRTPSTTWPDGFGRWDYRIAAQHLPEIYYSATKLWLEELAQKKKKKVTLLLHVALCKILIGLNWLKCTYCNDINIYNTHLDFCTAVKVNKNILALMLTSVVKLHSEDGGAAESPRSRGGKLCCYASCWDLVLGWRQLGAAWNLLLAEPVERSCPKSTMAMYSVVRGRNPNRPNERQTLYHWAITGWHSCINIASVICSYRQLLQHFYEIRLTFWELL